MTDENIIKNFDRINENFNRTDRNLDKATEIIVKHYVITKAILTFLFEELDLPIDKIDQIERAVEANWQKSVAKVMANDEYIKKEVNNLIKDMERGPAKQ